MLILMVSGWIIDLMDRGNFSIRMVWFMWEVMIMELNMGLGFWNVRVRIRNIMGCGIRELLLEILLSVLELFEIVK